MPLKVQEILGIDELAHILLKVNRLWFSDKYHQECDVKFWEVEKSLTRYV